MQVNIGQISAPATTPQLTLSANQVAAQNLTPGQQLAATVLATQPNGQVSLAVNNAQITATTDLVLTEGQLLNLIVEQIGKQTVLKLSDSSLQAALLSQALRTSLPKQGSLTDILANLRAIVQQPANAPLPSSTNSIGKERPALPLPALPPAVQQVARQLINNLPEPRQLSSAAGLKQALQNSGLFLEEKLRSQSEQPVAAGRQATPTPRPIVEDFKNNLLQLRQELVRTLATTPPVDSKTATVQTSLPMPSALPLSTAPPTTASPESIKQLQIALPQLQTLLQRDFQQSGAQLPKAAQEKLQTLVQHLEQLLPTITGKPQASATEQALPARALQLLQTLRPELQALLGQLAPLPASPNINALKSNLGALDNLFMALFGAGKKAPIAQAHVPPPLSRAPMHAQAAAPATLSQMQDSQQALHEMLRQTDAALARVQGHQTSSLMEQEAGRLLLNAEVPLRRGDQLDLLQLRIEEEEPEGGKEKFEQGITVTLSLDLEGTGPVYAKINVRREAVSLVFWAEEQETLQTATQNMEELEQRLTRIGLKPDQMSFLPGKPPQKEHPQTTHGLTTQLLDLKA